MRRLGLVALLLALVVTACGDDTADTTTTAPTTTIGEPGSLQEQIEALIEETERLRGLTFLEHPAVAILSEQQMADRVRELLDEQLPEDEVVVWQAAYEMLGLLDGTIDLRQAYIDLHAEQVGGFYGPDTGELAVMATAELTPLARSIVVHELVHALTEQHFGYAALMDDLVDEGRLDEAAALQALVEGDATYVQLAYIQGLPVAEQLAAVQESLDADTSVLDSLPSWFAEDLTFPYDAGFRFVTRLMASGGVAMVDQAYQRVPETTEQILHPEKYEIMEPALPVDLPTVALPGYEVFDEGTYGEWSLQLFLLDGIPPGDRAVAASGWGGDRYRLYWDGSNVAFAYLYEADTPDHAAELAAALIRATSGRMAVGPGVTSGDGVTSFGGGTVFARVHAGERRVLFIASTDPGAGAALAGSLAGAVETP